MVLRPMSRDGAPTALCALRQERERADMSILDDLRAKAARERRAALDRAHARMQRWQMKHGAKLAGMHPDVALEVRSVVLARFLAGNESGLTDEDQRQCRMRVASRLRIRRYGAC